MAIAGMRAWRELRSAEGTRLSQETLARKAGVTLSTIQRLENGEGEGSSRVARAIAQALNVTVEELFEGPPLDGKAS